MRAIDQAIAPFIEEDLALTDSRKWALASIVRELREHADRIEDLLFFEALE